MKNKVWKKFERDDDVEKFGKNSPPTHQPPQPPQPPQSHTLHHFIWDSKRAWANWPQGAQWLEDVVMPTYELSKYDRRIPLCLEDTFERATPGCCRQILKNGQEVVHKLGEWDA